METIQPPPLPPPPVPPRKLVFFAISGLSLALLAVAFVVWLLAICEDTKTSEHQIEVLRITVRLLLLGAVVPSFYALLKCRDAALPKLHDCAKLAIAFITCSSLMMVLAEVHYKKRQQALAKQSYNDLSNAAKELRNGVNRDLEKGENTTDKQAYLDRLQGIAKDIASKTSGDESRIMLASAAYLAELQKLGSSYSKAQGELDKGKVLQASLLTSREVIAQKRSLVTNFMWHNQQFIGFLKKSAQNYEAALRKQNISEANISLAMKGFRNRDRGRNACLLEIRQCDDDICRNYLNILDALDLHFDEWSFDAKTQSINIQNQNTRYMISLFYDEIEKAGSKQQAAQTKLLGINKNAPN